MNVVLDCVSQRKVVTKEFRKQLLTTHSWNVFKEICYTFRYTQGKLVLLHFSYLSVSHFMNIINFYIHTIIFLFSNVFLIRVVIAVGGQCPISKQGNPNGAATMFQVKFLKEKVLETFVFL